MAERILRIELPPGLKLLSANDREHYYARAKKAKVIREAAAEAVRALGAGKFSEVEITCIFRAPDNRRRDVHNLLLSYKPFIDGIVDAGLLEDDNDRIIRRLSIVRGENLPKLGQLIIEVREADGEQCLRARDRSADCRGVRPASRGELELPWSWPRQRRPQPFPARGGEQHGSGSYLSHGLQYRGDC